MFKFYQTNKFKIILSQRFSLLLLFAVTSIITGCKECQVSFEKRLDKEGIITIAKQEIIKRGLDPNQMILVYDQNNTSIDKYLNELRKDPFLKERYGCLLGLEYQTVSFLPGCLPECLGYSYHVIVDVHTGEVIKFLKFH
jgi:hypothetical protein